MKKLFIAILVMAVVISMTACSVNSHNRSPREFHDGDWATQKELLEATKATAKVTFINEDSGVTFLGLARFILNENGDLEDYELMNMRWSERKRIIELPPGLYGVTKGMPHQNAGVLEKVKGFQKFEVKEKDIMIHFPSMSTNNYSV